jgi:hypothetical protein
MKKFAPMLLAVVILAVVPNAGFAQGSPTDLGAGVVGVQIGSGPNLGTRILRLEYQLRIMAIYHSGGLTVTQVFPGGPATRLTLAGQKGVAATLEPGDLITHVNGQRITSQNDYYLAMYQAGARGGNVTISVVDVNTGRTFNWETVAEPVGGQRPPVVRPDARPATRVKALLIGDTADARIGDAVAVNLQKVEAYVRGLPGFNPETDLVVLSGRDCTAQNIMRAVQRLRVEPTEALFCYVACHGAYDPNLAGGDPSGGHFFQLNVDLMRKALLSTLRDRGAQLTVLITDTCNVPSIYEEPKLHGMPPRAIESRVLADLLFNHVGVVDVSGSSRDQYGWFTRFDGGWFTIGLVKALREWDGEHGGDWKTFLDAVSKEVSEEFRTRKEMVLANPSSANPDTRKKLSEQADQRPQVFQMEVKRVER